MAAIIYSSDPGFDFDRDVMNYEGDVIVDFWAEWCPPCRMIAPELEKLNTIEGDNLRIVKVDTDSNPQLSQRFGIMSIPTMFYLPKGAKTDATIIRDAGFKPVALLQNWLRANGYAPATGVVNTQVATEAGHMPSTVPMQHTPAEAPADPAEGTPDMPMAA